MSLRVEHKPNWKACQFQLMLSALERKLDLDDVLDFVSHLVLDIKAFHLPLRQKQDELIGTSAFATAFAN